MEKDKELMQGKAAWDIQKEAYGDNFCNKIEERVRMIGANSYWKLMEPQCLDIPQSSRDLMYLSLKYVEHINWSKTSSLPAPPNKKPDNDIIEEEDIGDKLWQIWKLT